jgi:excinuclease ABC subunit A
MQYIKIANANANNLKNVNIKLPLNQWITFAGKSGSGKSTLADVIFDGQMFGSENVHVPVAVSLFRQKVSIPGGNQTIFAYLGIRKRLKAISLGEVLSEYINENRLSNKELLIYAAKTMGIAFLQCDTPLSELSLTTFNKVRFIRFLLKNTAELLIIDELASGMCYAEARSIAMVLREIVKAGYSIIAIEHSLPMIEASDYIVEMGPGAGVEGGTVTFAGKTDDYLKSEHYKCILANISNKLSSNKIDRKQLKIENIDYHSLRLSKFSMPTNCIVNVCGLSGSGKTTLLDIVFRAFDKSANAWKNRAGINGEISGKAYIRRPHFVDQTPIGSNSMSTPATYTKIMDILRNIFAQLPESQVRGYSVSEYSYNSIGGCIQCRGRGVNEIVIGEETIFKPCSACNGSRYRDEINEIAIDGLSIGAMLQSPCGALVQQCSNRKVLTEKLNFIVDVGLSYLTLGQPSPSLSGGESQRIKITKELAKKLGDRSLFILDTPSRGLHPSDFDKVFIMMRRLVAKNNSMLIADNNPYFVRNADWIVVLDENHVAFQGYPSKLPLELISKLGLEV